MRALSRKDGISRSGLCQLLLDEGVVLRKLSITPDDAVLAVQLYERGLTIRQVMDQVGYSYGTIQRMLNEKGVALRAGGRGNRAAPDE